MARPSTANRKRGEHRLLAKATIVGAIVLGLGLAELCVRWIAPQWILVDGAKIWLGEEGIGRRQKPNLDLKVNTGDREVRFRTDARGHRYTSAPLQTPKARILVLGDSQLAAFAIPDEAHLITLLESFRYEHRATDSSSAKGALFTRPGPMSATSVLRGARLTGRPPA